MATKRQTVLRVQKYRGELVFVHGKLRLDRLTVYSLPPKRNKRKFKVEREGKIVDEAIIDEYGTHGAADYFIGFGKIAPATENTEPSPFSEPILSEVLSKWFVEGDILYLPFDYRSFGSSIREYWREHRQFASRYSRARKVVDAEYFRLEDKYKRSFKQKHGFDFLAVIGGERQLPPKDISKLIRELRLIEDRATRPFYRLLRQERLPRVVRLDGEIIKKRR